MHGKRLFPWPQQIPKLTLHNVSEHRVLHLTWCEGSPISASLHALDRSMGIRLDSLLSAGEDRHTLASTPQKGSLAIQLR